MLRHRLLIVVLMCALATNFIAQAATLTVGGTQKVTFLTDNGSLSARGGHGSDSLYIATKTDSRDFHSGGTCGVLLNPTVPYTTAAGCDGAVGEIAQYVGMMASNPMPENCETAASIFTGLSWAPSPEATSQNVYLGTASPPTTLIASGDGTLSSVANVSLNSGNPLPIATLFYWRVDEVFGPNTTTGRIWTFTTTDGSASNPSPAASGGGAGPNTILRWTTGEGAVSHDVYLGTDAAGVQSAERLFGDLDGNRKVDYGDLLIFTDYWLQNPAGSEPYAGTNSDSIVDFSDYTLLAESCGGQSSPYFKGNTNGTSYDDPCDFAQNTTYYWRVDEINSGRRLRGDVWSFTTVRNYNNIVGKIMCGYQGWFNCPGDGTTRQWVHWSKSRSSFLPGNASIEMWPDMTEMTSGEKYEATGFVDGSNHYYVFSSHNRDTVLRHFQWMQTYGIDGVYLQRFASEVKSQTSASFLHRNDVLSYCRDGANMNNRLYAVMYDLSGLKAGETSYVINDWKYLVDTKKVTRDPNDNAYMYYKGKPVVAIWGIGFNDGRAYTLQECLDLVNFFKNDPLYGGCTVMVGVPSYWRTLDRDCVSDPMVHTIVLAADIVSPWSVGRYGASGVSNYASSVWTPDIAWCAANGKTYLPVIWPGYSFHNADPAKPFNEMPRNGGQFLWSQVNSEVTTVGANMLYVAMFDEVDEGTAIFKVTNSPPRPGGLDMFLTYEGLPSDEYLWLVGQAGRGLRGEIPVTESRPAR